ncbi:YveK family protein [Terrisporobacter sp.]
MEKMIGFGELINIIKKRFLIIFIINIICIILGVIATNLIKPVYESTALVMIQIKNKEVYSDAISNDKVLAEVNLTNSYSKMMKSRNIINKVISSLNLDTKYDELIENISIKQEEETNLITINVQDKNPKKSSIIANSICSLSKKEISKLEGENRIKVIDKAPKYGKLVNLNKMAIIILSVILGIILSIIGVICLERIDDKIRRIDDIECYLGINVIGIIPRK